MGIFFNSTEGEPHIDLDGGPTYAKENTTITLPKCHVTGSPTPEVEWSKDGGSLSPQAVVEDGKLKLFNVTKEDEGEYECRAKNTVGSERSKTKLEVIQVPVKPPEDLVVVKGNDSSVRCHVCTASVETSEFTVGKMQLILTDGKPMIHDSLHRSFYKFIHIFVHFIFEDFM